MSCLLVGCLLIALWSHVDSSPPTFERARLSLASSFLPAHLAALTESDLADGPLDVPAGAASMLGVGRGSSLSSSRPFAHAHYYLTGQFFGEGGRRLPHLLRREPLYVSRQAAGPNPTREPCSWESPRCERHLGLQMLLYATLYGVARSVVRSPVKNCCLLIVKLKYLIYNFRSFIA